MQYEQALETSSVSRLRTISGDEVLGELEALADLAARSGGEVGGFLGFRDSNVMRPERD
jgi:hypothetical protein